MILKQFHETFCSSLTLSVVQKVQKNITKTIVNLSEYRDSNVTSKLLCPIVIFRFFCISICTLYLLTQQEFVICMTKKNYRSLFFPRLHKKQILQLLTTVFKNLKIHSEINFLYLLDGYLHNNVASGYARYWASSKLRSKIMFWLFFSEMKISLSTFIFMIKTYAQVCFEAVMATMAQQKKFDFYVQMIKHIFYQHKRCRY